MVMMLWVATGWSNPGHGMGGGPGGFGAPYFGRLLRALHPTEAQRAQIRDLMTAHRPTFKSLHSQIQATRQHIADLLLTPAAVDSAALDAATQQLESQHSQLLAERLTLAQEIRKVLTPEQLARAAQLKDQLRDLHTSRRQLLGDEH
jgi:Spy/CpxP family protein refolding chaperone